MRLLFLIVFLKNMLNLTTTNCYKIRLHTFGFSYIIFVSIIFFDQTDYGFFFAKYKIINFKVEKIIFQNSITRVTANKLKKNPFDSICKIYCKSINTLVYFLTVLVIIFFSFPFVTYK